MGNERPKIGPWVALLTILALMSGIASAARGETAHIAVASNFRTTAEEIADAFEEETGHRALLSFGSTGKLFTQIAYGAPYEVFLAADRARPERAESEGLAVVGSRIPYARGRLVLYSSDATLIEENGPEVLRGDRVLKLAIANPGTAPYGAAALEVMRRLGVEEALRTRIVRGDNIAQTYQFVATGNAQLGFIALSQVLGEKRGSSWRIPDEFYGPILQEAVLLEKGEESRSARAFLNFLQGKIARRIIESHGYGLN